MTSPLGKHFDIIRKQNLKQILKILRKKGSATKAELAEASSLSFPTVGRLLEALKITGEVMSLDFEASTGGRRAERFEINPLNTLILTLFIEDAVLWVRIYDSTERIVFATSQKSTHLHCLEDLLHLIDQSLLTYPTIRYLSIGLPAAIIDGVPFFAPDYPTLEGVNLIELLYERTGLPASVENDVNCMVKGYALNHFGNEFPDMVYIFNGANGPGSGIMNGGNVAKGVSGFAGELGFLPFSEGETLCNIILKGSRIEQIQAFAKVVAILACVVNPCYVVFSGAGSDPDYCTAIRLESEKYIPKDRIPICLYAAQLEEDYFSGLIDIGMSIYLDQIELN